MLSVFENVNKDLKEAIENSCEDDGSCCNYCIYRYIVIEDCGLHEFKTLSEVISIEATGYGMFKDITKRFSIEENISINFNNIIKRHYLGNNIEINNIKDIITEWKDKIIL
jgi:hypothetical protein